MFLIFDTTADGLNTQVDALIQRGFTLRVEGASTLVVSGDAGALRALQAEVGGVLGGEEPGGTVGAEPVPEVPSDTGTPEDTEAPWTSCVLTLWDKDAADLVLAGQQVMAALSGHVRYRAPSTEWLGDRWAINFDVQSPEAVGGTLAAAVEGAKPISWALATIASGWAAGSAPPEKPVKKKKA